MNRTALLQARVQYVGWRAGPVGWAGLALFSIALVLTGISRFDLEPSNRAAVGELAQLKAQLERAAAPGAALRNPTDAMAAVAGQLPAADQAPVFIQDVQARASRGGVQIERAEYRLQTALGKHALRLQVVMPAHGGYPQLRAWLQSLLADYPNAALDELTLRREADGSAQLETRVALSYYTQAVR